MKWHSLGKLTHFQYLCVGWLVVLGLTALSGSISVYIGPSSKKREKERGKDRREQKRPNNPTPALTASIIGTCPTTIIQMLGRPGTGRLPKTVAPPDHLLFSCDFLKLEMLLLLLFRFIKQCFLFNRGGRVVPWSLVNFQCRGVLQFRR